MMGSILFNWASALMLGRCKRAAGRRACLAAALAGNVSILGFFKYADFAVASINAAVGEQFLSSLQLDLPIGISFFTL